MQTENRSEANYTCRSLSQGAVIFLSVFFTFIVLFCNDSFSAEDSSYKVEIRGIKDRKLLSQVRDLSRTLELSSEPAGSVNILRKRIRDDIEIFKKFLKSEGYFNAEISERVDTNSKPWRVILDFSCNAPFVLSSVKFKFTPEGRDDVRAPDISKADIITGERYRSKTILEGEDKLLLLIREQGFPDPVIEKREIIADHGKGTVRVEYVINPGKRAYFGDTHLTGLETVDSMFIMKFIPWKTGDMYDPGLLNRCYTDLMNLGLFSRVKITEGRMINDNVLPVEIDLTERKHKTVSAGMNYHTDEGLGFKFSWEHRNLFGRGEKLAFSFNLSNYLNAAEAVFRKPAFLVREQTLRLSLVQSHDAPDAYTSNSFTSSVSLDRQVTEKLDVSGGFAYKSSKIDQLGIENNYSLLLMPLLLNLNNSDDLLDPSRGGRLAVKLIPYYELSKESLFYTKGLIDYRHYLTITDDPQLTLAGSISVGTMKGASRDEIPADERFYAGGGGSIRGYPYLSVGPLVGTTPVGGKAVFETSFEARLKLTPRFGFVVFMDGGSAFKETLFEQGEIIRWGTGAGLRYFTPIGPLRLDVGIPLNRRELVDDPFQVYISIGQAF